MDIFFFLKVEQLHKIFKLCGSPSEEYWKRSRLPNATLFKPQQPYKRSTVETFKDFPPSSLPLLENLLAIDPDKRGSAVASLNSDVSFQDFTFFEVFNNNSVFWSNLYVPHVYSFLTQNLMLVSLRNYQSTLQAKNWMSN